MDLILAHIGAARLHAKDDLEKMIASYLERCSPVARCWAQPFRAEQDLLDWLDRHQARTSPVAVLLDSRGRQMTSEAFASWIGSRRDEGARQLLFALGPASGWSDASRRRAQLLLSFGPMTMAHALARLVMAEQLYRACTILAGHPYHTGH